MTGDARLHAAHKRLKEYRQRTDLSLKATPLLKTTFTGFDGEEHPFKLRYYQVQGVLHLVAMNRFLLGDDTGIGKTIQSIASLCFVWAKQPDMKAVILTNKSVVGQWALEFEKFCAPDSINVITCVGSPAKREKVYQEFEQASGPTVLIMGYATSRRDIKHIQHWKDFVLICDEATAFKNPTTQTYKVVRHLSKNASRFWALTATLIKNNLIEGYGIYSLLVPGLFPPSKNKFMMEYCLTRLQQIPGTRRQIPVIIGYRKDQIERFRDKIDPYFLARAKFDVATELPVLQIKQHKCGMTRAQEAKYREALEGLLEKDRTDEEVETTKLTSLIYCQQIVDHPELVDCEGDSDKMKELFELLTEGDLAGEKIIVFSRFRKMIDKLEEVASSKKYKLKSVRITGAETDEHERKAAMQQFQDPNNDVQICWITMAAAEGINLQAAKAIVFYDSPWSAGDYLQILGRMIRIGSKHDRCYAIHLVAKGTIDTKVMSVLRTKMKLIEQVMGKRLKGEGMDDVAVSADNSIDDIFQALQQDARKYA
jgi:SNF2 family DNA or RNA helicase